MWPPHGAQAPHGSSIYSTDAKESDNPYGVIDQDSVCVSHAASRGGGVVLLIGRLVQFGNPLIPESLYCGEDLLAPLISVRNHEDPITTLIP